MAAVADRLGYLRARPEGPADLHQGHVSHANLHIALVLGFACTDVIAFARPQVQEPANVCDGERPGLAGGQRDGGRQRHHAPAVPARPHRRGGPGAAGGLRCARLLRLVLPGALGETFDLL